MFALIQFVVVVLIIWYAWKMLFPKTDKESGLGDLIEYKQMEIKQLQERRRSLETEIGMTDKLMSIDADIRKAMEQLGELEQQFAEERAKK